MELLLHEADADSVRAGYVCPCGCQPSVTYERTGVAVNDGCCCGNEFAVGPEANTKVEPKAGYRAQATSFRTPWGETIGAFWLIGASVHGGTSHDSSHGEHHGDESDGSHGHDRAGRGDHPETPTQIDPVCGMTVDAQTAVAKGLSSTHDGRDYYFCGRGCKLEFDEDPNAYLDPSYVPSMWADATDVTK